MVSSSAMMAIFLLSCHLPKVVLLEFYLIAIKQLNYHFFVEVRYLCCNENLGYK